MTKLPYLRTKKAKGRTYYYFDAGKSSDGRSILNPLPDIRHPGFAKAYQNAKAQRTKSAAAETAKSFDWLCRIFERSPEYRELAESSKQLYSLHLEYANRNFRSGDGRSWPVAIVTAEDAVALRDKFADRPGKANATLKALGALYSWAAKPGRRYVKENIVTGVERLGMGEHEPWPEWLIEEALNDPSVRLPVALLYFLGQRIGDTVKMGPQNMAGGAIHLKQQKTGTALTIPVHSRLAKIIEQDAPRGAMLFLLNERGKPMTGPALRARLQTWAEKHGQEIVPHGLRKSAVNALLIAGCSAAEVGSITGQSLQMIEHYAKQRDMAGLASSAIIKLEARNARETNRGRENAS